MRKIFFTLACLMMTLGLVACSEQEEKLYPFLEVNDNYAVYSFMNKEGERVFDKEYDDVLMNFDDGYAVVYNSNKLSIIDSKGEVHLTDIDNVYAIKDNKATAKKGDKVKLYDLKEGKELMSYDYIKMETEGLYPFLEKGLWGYRDLQGSKILEPDFDEAYNFGDKGKAIAIKDGKTFVVDKELNRVEINYTDAVVLEDSSYIVATHEGHQSLLDLNGRVLIDDIPGDITEFKDDYFVVFNRVDGVLKKEIYNIDSKKAFDEVFDEIRLLGNGFFAVQDHEKYALYSFKEGRLTDYKYDFINADFYKENGGIVVAAYDGKAVHLNKSGIENKVICDGKAISIIRDKNLNIVETLDNTLYIDDEGVVIKSSPKIGQTGVLRIVIKEEDNKPYPFIIHEQLKKGTNESIKDMVNKLTDSKKISYKYKLEGDILYVSVLDGDNEYPFMLDIYEGRIIDIDDILNSEISEQYLLNEAIKMADLEDDSKLICISYSQGMTMTIRSGEQTKTVELPYHLVEQYIDAKSGLFFKALLAPRINK